MFNLNESLRNSIMNKLDKSIKFASLNEIYASGDCPCQGGCGTYVPPCSCCGYN